MLHFHKALLTVVHQEPTLFDTIFQKIKSDGAKWVWATENSKIDTIIQVLEKPHLRDEVELLIQIIERSEKPNPDPLIFALAMFLDNQYMKDKLEKFNTSVKTNLEEESKDGIAKSSTGQC